MASFLYAAFRIVALFEVLNVRSLAARRSGTSTVRAAATAPMAPRATRRRARARVVAAVQAS